MIDFIPFAFERIFLRLVDSENVPKVIRVLRTKAFWRVLSDNLNFDAIFDVMAIHV